MSYHLGVSSSTVLLVSVRTDGVARRPLDGKIFKVSEMLISENAPPMHPNCRCSTSASMGLEGDVNYAKSFDDSIKQNIHESMWIYSLEDARKELLKSPVGIDTINAIKNSDVIINVINMRMHPTGSRGEQFGDRIDIYARQCQNDSFFRKQLCMKWHITDSA